MYLLSADGSLRQQHRKGIFQSDTDAGSSLIIRKLLLIDGISKHIPDLTAAIYCVVGTLGSWLKAGFMIIHEEAWPADVSQPPGDAGSHAFAVVWQLLVHLVCWQLAVNS